MINSEEIKKIEDATRELLNKITLTDFEVQSKVSYVVEVEKPILEEKKELDAVDLDIKLKEPQILIGSDGQTLFELQRILRIILNKKLKKNFYLKLDINDYAKKKIEYLKSLANDLANEVSFTKKKKILAPMPAYQRRIIHIELAQRPDIITESQGNGADRYIVINPKRES